MSNLLNRRSNPLAELVGWLEGDGSAMRTLGLAPTVPIEDFLDDGTYVLRAQMPGLDPEHDFHVNVEGDILTIEGERVEMHREENRSEFHYGSFARSVTLPAGSDVDALTAEYRDGLLEVRVPVSESADPRRIRIERPES